jgi:hypothetical protein
MSQRLGLPISSLQHECYKLVRIGLLRDERQGNSRKYCPDARFPLLAPLTTLVARSSSLVEVARGSVEAVPGVEQAWISGELADFDRPAYFVVVGWVGLEEIDSVFDRVRLAIQAHYPERGIELAYLPPDAWQKRLSANDRFTRELCESARVELKGIEDRPGMAESTVELNATEKVANARWKRTGKGEG